MGEDIKINMTKTVMIDFATMKSVFGWAFEPPRVTEVYYRSGPEGWELQFFKNGYYIKCRVSREEIVSEYRKDNAIADPVQLRGAIDAFESYYLKYAIEILEEKEETEMEQETQIYLSGHERTYVKDPSHAPPGADVKKGPRGGYYYDDAHKDSNISDLSADVQNHLNGIISGKTDIPMYNKQIKELFSSRGHSDETISKVLQIKDQLASSTQSTWEKTEGKIIENIQNNTDVGKMFKDISNLENEYFKRYWNNVGNRIDARFNKAKKEIERGESSLFSHGVEDMDSLRRKIEHDEKFNKVSIFRAGGRSDKDIEYWSETEDPGQFQSDVESTIPRILTEGEYVILGGWRVFPTGAPDDDEITFIKKNIMEGTDDS